MSSQISRRAPIIAVAALVIPSMLAGCGAVTPDKNPFMSDAPNPDDRNTTSQGNYENAIVNHVTCEIAQGLTEVKELIRKNGQSLRWLLEDWGTTVTQTITVEDQTGLAPGISTITPFHNVVFPFSTGGNVVAPQSFSLNFGGTVSANGLRTETIQYTFRNKDILSINKNSNEANSCASTHQKGFMIDGDLKIREFIYDKATIAAFGNASLQVSGPLAWQVSPFNTFTEEITFVAAYGGSFTPTWKLAQLTANASSNLLIAERTNTNDLIITLGPLETDPKKKSKSGPVQLTQEAMTQHNARVSANAIAVSIQGQTH